MAQTEFDSFADELEARRGATEAEPPMLSPWNPDPAGTDEWAEFRDFLPQATASPYDALQQYEDMVGQVMAPPPIGYRLPYDPYATEPLPFAGYRPDPDFIEPSARLDTSQIEDRRDELGRGDRWWKSLRDDPSFTPAPRIPPQPGDQPGVGLYRNEPPLPTPPPPPGPPDWTERLPNWYMNPFETSEQATNLRRAAQGLPEPAGPPSLFAPGQPGANALGAALAANPLVEHFQRGLAEPPGPPPPGRDWGAFMDLLERTFPYRPVGSDPYYERNFLQPYPRAGDRDYKPPPVWGHRFDEWGNLMAGPNGGR